MADRFRPDIVLVDVMMPGGSGLDVVRHLAADPALNHAGCVVVSAFAAETDLEEAREAGATAFVSKPFDPDDLSATVASLLVRRPLKRMRPSGIRPASGAGTSAS